MSDDKRPGKVRVLSAGDISPQRRRTDPQTIVDPAAAASAAARAAHAPTSRGWGITLALLFVVASATGGVLAAWFDLAAMLAR
jgi:hypothetical protein